MMRYPLRLLFFLFPVILSGQGNTQVADSLLNLLEKAEGKEKIEIMINLGVTLAKKDTAQGLPYLRQSLALAGNLHDTLNYILACYNIAGINLKLKDLKECEQYVQRSEYFTRDSGSCYYRYYLWLITGTVYMDEGYLDEAERYFRKIILHLPGDEQWAVRSMAYVWLAEIYQTRNQHREALDVLQKNNHLILSCFKRNDVVPVNRMLSYLENLGRYYTFHGFYAKAAENNRIILDSLSKFDLTDEERVYFRAKFFGHLARAYSKWGKFTEALMFHDSSAALFSKGIESLTGQSGLVVKQNIGGDWQINLANQLEGKATALAFTGRYDSSEANFRLSLNLRKVKNDLLGIADCYDGLGFQNQLQGDYLSAYHYFDSAFNLKQNYWNELKGKHTPPRGNQRFRTVSESMVETLLRIGNLYLEWNKSDMAVEQYRKALSLSRETGLRKGEAEAMSGMGDVFKSFNRLDSARIYYSSALEIFRETDILSETGNTYRKLGAFFLLLGRYDSAVQFLDDAMVIYRDLNLQREQAEAYIMLGNISLKKRDFQKARFNFEECLLIAGNTGILSLIMESHRGLSEVFSALHNTESAFEHYKAYISARDSVYSLDAKRLIHSLEVEHKTALKEQHIYLLQKENEIKQMQIGRSRNVVISLGGLLLLLFITAILFIRQERLKMGQKAILLQQKLLRSQMNPHFIFNSLTNIQSFIFSNKGDEAGRYLARFSKLLRNVLNNSREDEVSLQEEIETMENYLSLQQLRYTGKFDFSVGVAENVDPTEIRIPPMLAQPFIENAVEHGIKHKPAKGNIRVEFRMKDKYMECVVEDDGVGRTRAQEMEQAKSKGHKSLATSITSERLDALSRKYHHRFTLVITDLTDEWGGAAGTRAMFSFPFSK